MAEFKPVQTVDDFRRLDDGEILEGYFDGFDGESAPDSTRSRSYWHGWRNGQVDSGRCQPDQAYLTLADAFSELARCNVEKLADLGKSAVFQHS